MAAWERGGVEEADARTRGRKGGLVPLVAMEVKRRVWMEKIFSGNGVDCDRLKKGNGRVPGRCWLSPGISDRREVALHCLPGRPQTEPSLGFEQNGICCSPKNPRASWCQMSDRQTYRDF